MHLGKHVVFPYIVGCYASRISFRSDDLALTASPNDPVIGPILSQPLTKPDHVNVPAKKKLTFIIEGFCEAVRVLADSQRLTTHCAASASTGASTRFTRTWNGKVKVRQHANIHTAQCGDLVQMCASFNFTGGQALADLETSSANNGKLLASPDGQFIAKFIQPNECLNFMWHYKNMPPHEFEELKMLNIAMVVLHEKNTCEYGAYAIFRRMDSPPLAATYEGGVLVRNFAKKFDLKGSTFNRDSKESDAEQKDLNFLNKFPEGIRVSREAHQILSYQLRNAAKWLGKKLFTDYSFMVYPMETLLAESAFATDVPRVITDETNDTHEPYILIGGILDNLETYLDKRYQGKNWIQAVFKFPGISESISVAPAYQYACRFYLTLTRVMFLPHDWKARKNLEMTLDDIQHLCHSVFTLEHKGGTLTEGQFVNFMDMQ